MPEIEIRPAVFIDLPVLATMDHSIETGHVWQMDRMIDNGHISINFREVRLPRTVRVEYPNPFVWEDKNILEDPGLLVAEMDGQQVGYIYIKPAQQPFTAWVRDLAVRPDLRRKGIGSALILSAQEWALRRNLRRLVIEMQSKNFPAIQMVLKLGCDFCGYNDHYYTNQDIALFFASFLR